MTGRRPSEVGPDVAGPGRDPRDPLVAFCTAFADWRPHPYPNGRIPDDLRPLLHNVDRWVVVGLGSRKYSVQIAVWLLIVLARFLRGMTRAELEAALYGSVKKNEDEKARLSDAINNGYWQEVPHGIGQQPDAR